MNSRTHSHSLSIDPRELTPGSVLVGFDVDCGVATTIATRKCAVMVAPHDDDADNSTIAPMEHVLIGLALSAAQMVKLVVTLKALDVKKIFVAVSQKREDQSASLMREIIIEGSISEDDRQVIEAYAEKCPVSAFLNSDSTVITSVS